MNLTIELSERGVRDGVFLTGAYHFLLAMVALLGTLAVFVYAILPSLSNPSADNAQSLFLPITGTLVGVVLSLAYTGVGIGLIKMRNSARMTAIFLSLFGILIGVFSFLGGIVGAVNTTQPDWTAIGMISLMLVCVYSLIAFLDIVVLIFLLNWRVRSVFYGEEWLAEAVESISSGQIQEERESAASSPLNFVKPS